MAHESPRPTESSRRSKLKVRGGEIAYETAGKGSPILFLHSAIADHRQWDRELPLYAADHQCIRFDQRGYGGSTPATAEFSQTDDIQALLDHLKIGRAYLVGSSMGGAYAINYAIAHPDRVRGMLLVAPGLSGGVLPPYTASEQAAFELDDRKSQEIAQVWSKGDAGRAFDLLRQLWCVALEGPNLALFRRMVEENTAEVFDNRSSQRESRPPAPSDRLPTLRIPTIVMIGDRDNPSSEPFARRIAGAIPHARLVQVSGADHLINLSRPSAFDDALRAGLAASA